MASGEFELISRYFNRESTRRKDVLQGIGDDCALLQLAESQTLAISTDTLVAGTHFLPTIAPGDLGYKALAVNLSDLAAMGADPAWLTLALTLPAVDDTWLQQFSDSLFSLLDYYEMQLIGGDTTRGPLAMTLTIHGFVPYGKALRRSGAAKGDWIFVTGTLGDSTAGLAILLQKLTVNSPDQREYLLQRHLRPTPRILQGQAIRHLASAAVDISDGLSADLAHLLAASQVGATIDLDKLPLSQALLQTVGREQSLDLALHGGEDYEICFTVPESNKGALALALDLHGVDYTCIGQIISKHEGFQLVRNNQLTDIKPKGFDHFR
jgi:thiamine-monophosphate kinase